MVMSVVMTLLAAIAVGGLDRPVSVADTIRTYSCDYEISKDVLKGPTFTPFHERPRMIDRAGLLKELRGQIEEVDPSGGLDPVSYWILIAPRGCVVRVEITNGSGNARVDQFIHSWLESAEFTRPLLRSGMGLTREAAVAVWLRERLDLRE
jgi:hypothetical protein